MAFRFGDSFDGYDTPQLLENWTSVAAAGIDLTNQRNGRGCLGVSGAGISKTLDFFATGTVGAAMKWSTYGGGPLFANNGNIGCALDLQNDGTFRIVNGVGTLLGQSSPLFPLSLGVYYFVELQATCNHITGSFILKVNGKIVAQATGVDTDVAAGFPGTWDQLILHGPGGSGTMYYDDLYFNDGTIVNAANPNNTFLGNIISGVIVPRAPGNYTDFTPFPGAPNWDNVNEIPPDGDTSYNFSSTNGDRDSYLYQPVSLLLGYFALQVRQVCRQDAIGTVEVEPFTRVAGSDYVSTVPPNDFFLSQNYNSNLTPFEINPATGLAWTGAEINASEFGIHLISSS